MDRSSFFCIVRSMITIYETIAEMNYYKRNSHMDLTDRVAIETNSCRGELFAANLSL